MNRKEIPVSFRHTIWQVENEFGHNQEKRAIDIINDLNLPWITSVRLGTQDEDRRGIDIVVETTDIGKIFFQIKSSNRWVKKFMHHHGNSRTSIALIILAGHLNPEQKQQIIQNALDKEREKILRMRGIAI